MTTPPPPPQTQTQPLSLSLLLINPNSTHSITTGLSTSLLHHTPPNTTLSFFTAPSHAPPSIDDITTGIQSAVACYDEIVREGLVERYDGFLVCCFSDHPLTPMLRLLTPKPVLGILEASLSTALLLSLSLSSSGSHGRFGIITTGPSGLYRSDIHTAVHAFLGSSSSSRFAGVKTTGLGVVELRDNPDREYVRRRVREAGAEMGREMGGCGCILMGCAGMSGMEGWVGEGFRGEGGGVGMGAGDVKVKVIDGVRAGVGMLVALAGM